MNDVEGFAQEVLVDDERDVRFAGTLGTGNDADTRTAKRSEEFAGNARCMLHLLAYDSNGSKTLFGNHREHRSVLDFFLELLVQNAAGLICIHVLNTDTGAVFAGCLTHHKDADAVVCQTGEDAAVDTNHTHHREA